MSRFSKAYFFRGWGACLQAATGPAGAAGIGINVQGSNYSEMFEWADGNRDNEDRRGCFVTPLGKFIRIANSQEHILGAVSSSPALSGNAQCEEWQGRYLRDEWGQVIRRWQPTTRKGNQLLELLPVVNPAYDPEREYKGRNQRPEWAPICLLGNVPVRDDGTCRPGGFCWPNNRGIATTSEKGFYILDRIAADKIYILVSSIGFKP